MRALRRNTLEWEEINIKGQKIWDVLKFSDGTIIDYRNALAVDGDVKAGKLGYCSYCGKVMSKKEFEKHISKKASAETCKNCYYCKHKEEKLVKKNGQYVFKANAYCSHESTYLNPELKCTYGVCQGEFKKEVVFKRPKVNNKILTVSAFLNDNWTLDGINKRSRNIVFKHYKHNLCAYIDSNGYLLYFYYKNYSCYYSEKADALITYTDHVVTTNNNILKVIRRLYEN